jgi:Raf kinase inhibitor-like YbhB/YbcL family protein
MFAPIVATLALFSSSFAPGAPMPTWTAHGDASCPGEDRSPELHWSGVPAGTRSLALIVFDPDARGGWYHWVVYDMPPTQRGFAVDASLPKSELGITSFGERRYGGPCPPPGLNHHYVFTLYALDVAHIGASRGLDGPQTLARLRGHVIAKAKLVGRYWYGR